MKKQPKLSNEERIATALTGLDRANRILVHNCQNYNAFIDEATNRGDDARARKLIHQKLHIKHLSEKLITLKSHLMVGVLTAQTMSTLNTLPGLISGCKGLLAESPDFSKLENDIKSIFEDIDKTERGIDSLNNVIDPPATNTWSDILGETSLDEQSDEFKAEYQAAIDRAKVVIAAQSVAKPVAYDTGDINCAGIMNDENNKHDD